MTRRIPLAPLAPARVAARVAALVASLLAAPRAHAQPDARFTTRDLWVVYTKDQKAFAAQWYGKTLEVTGPLWATHVRGAGSESDLQLSVNGVARAVECRVSEADKAGLAALAGTKAEITVRGPWTVNYGSVVLSPCTYQVGSPPPLATGPADAPLGTYAVRQMANLTTYAWQYDLTLIDRGHYRLNDRAVGAYQYDARAKTLRFTSGELKGFVGLYYVNGKNADGPTIALDAEGGVPDPEHAARGRYQYATPKAAGDR